MSMRRRGLSEGDALQAVGVRNRRTARTWGMPGATLCVGLMPNLINARTRQIVMNRSAGMFGRMLKPRLTPHSPISEHAAGPTRSLHLAGRQGRVPGLARRSSGYAMPCGDAEASRPACGRESGRFEVLRSRHLGTARRLRSWLQGVFRSSGRHCRIAARSGVQTDAACRHRVGHRTMA
jgi:hypothetical protein